MVRCELIDTTDDVRDVNIGHALINNGVAEPCEEPHDSQVVGTLPIGDCA